MPTRGRFVCHVHCLVRDGAVRSSPCRPHHENFGRNLYHMFVPAYSASQILSFVLWYSSCFEVKCWIHTFPKWCSYIAMWILILLDHRGRHVKFFSNRCVFSSSGSLHFNIREINSQLFATVFASSVPSCLCFPALPPFFLKHSYLLIKYPSYGCEVSSFFSSMFLTGDFSWRCSRSFKFIILFSSPVDSSQAFSVDRILFLVSNAFSCRRIS